MLNIQLFGVPEIRVGGHLVPVGGKIEPRLRTRKGLWLLALLTLRANQEVEREWLADNLWIDSDNEPRNNLRAELTYLRKALGSEANRLESPTRGTLLLNLVGAQVDVIEFDSGISKTDDIHALNGAVDLYRTGLLEGCTDVWVVTERLDREQKYLKALRTLADKAIEREDFLAAFQFLKKITVREPFDDDAIRKGMRVLTDDGKWPAAVDLYKQYSNFLNRELNTTPDKVTTELYHQLRAEAKQIVDAHERRNFQVFTSPSETLATPPQQFVAASEPDRYPAHKPENDPLIKGYLHSLNKQVQVEEAPLSNDVLGPNSLIAASNTVDELEAKYCAWMRARYQDFPVQPLAGETNVLQAAQVEMTDRHKQEDYDHAERSHSTVNRPHQPEPKPLQATLATLEVEGKPQHIAIAGNAGAGKTTLLHGRVLHYLSSDSKPERVPILFKARAWERSTQTLEDYIRSTDYLEEALSLKQCGNWLLNQVRMGRAALLVDGVDETVNPHDILKRLQSFADDVIGRQTDILITCRSTVPLANVPRFQTVLLCLLTPDEIKRYIAERLHADKSTQLITALESNPKALNLMGDGLLLGMVCYVMENTTALDTFCLPVANDDLYEELTHLLLEDPKNWDRSSRAVQGFYKPEDIRRKQTVLEVIAFHTLFCRQDTDRNRLQEQLIGSLPDLSDNDRQALFDDIVKNSGIIRAWPILHPQRFEWTHLTFAEYFAARYLVAHWNVEGWDKWLPCIEDWQENTSKFHCTYCDNTVSAFSELIGMPEYRETLLLMVGMLKDKRWERTFLSGVVQKLPPIPGWRSGMTWLWELNEDGKLVGALFQNGVDVPADEWGFIEVYVAYDRIQSLLEFALYGLARCRYEHPNLVSKALTGLKEVSWRRSYDDACIALARGRCRANVLFVIKPYEQLLLQDCIFDEREAWYLSGQKYEKEVIKLGRIGGDEVVTILTKLLKSEWYEGVRKEAAWALGNIGGEAAIVALMESLKDRPFRHGSDTWIVETWMLGKIGGPEEKKLAIAMLKKAILMEGSDDAIQIKRAWVLGKIGDPEEKKIAIAMLKNTKKSTTSVQAIQDIGGTEAIKLLKSMLKDKDIIVRSVAAKALGEIRALDAVAALINVLKIDRNSLVRKEAAWALGEIQATEAIAILKETLKDSNWEVRIEAAVALNNIGGTEERKLALAVFKEVLKDVNNSIRIHVVHMLGHCGELGAVALLKEVLKDGDAFIRVEAAWALGQIGGSEEERMAAEVLEEIAEGKDNPSRLRIKAVKILLNSRT